MIYSREIRIRAAVFNHANYQIISTGRRRLGGRNDKPHTRRHYINAGSVFSYSSRPPNDQRFVDQNSSFFPSHSHTEYQITDLAIRLQFEVDNLLGVGGDNVRTQSTHRKEMGA